MKENGRDARAVWRAPCRCSVCPDSGAEKRQTMNQMLQDAEVQNAEVQKAQEEAETQAEAHDSSEGAAPPPVPAHPRFAKPQRIAFVQACWHREVVEEARIAFLDEIETRHIARERVDVF